jgi:signal peptidase I
VQPGSFFALGDNSANSLDSRYWGFVPDRNVVGRGLFVYWPFSSHWGFVR